MQGRNKLFFGLLLFTVLIFMVPRDSNSTAIIPCSETQVPVGVSIQEAINNASDGDTIIIQNGIHTIGGDYPVIVNKSVTLTGQDVKETIVEGRSTSVGILLVKVYGVRILNMTIRNTLASFSYSAILLSDVRNVEVSDCILTNCGSGVQLTNSTNNNVTRNTIIDNNSVGIYLHANSSSNRISSNNITNNPTGIYILDTSCQYNSIHHNNFIANAAQQTGSGTANNWDNGYPSGGNYWDDHTNEDLLNGPYQNINGGDGIADTSYQELDHYPLVEPIYPFFLCRWNEHDYYAEIVSNSTVVDFHFDSSLGSFMSHSVVGDSGTRGCCRITIPRSVLWIEQDESWAIRVNETIPVSVTWTLEDSANAYLYFTYDHSTQSIKIIGTHVVPELSLLAVLLLIALLSAGLLFAERPKARKPTY